MIDRTVYGHQQSSRTCSWFVVKEHITTSHRSHYTYNIHMYIVCISPFSLSPRNLSRSHNTTNTCDRRYSASEIPKAENVSVRSFHTNLLSISIRFTVVTKSYLPTTYIYIYIHTLRWRARPRLSPPASWSWPSRRWRLWDSGSFSSLDISCRACIRGQTRSRSGAWSSSERATWPRMDKTTWCSCSSWPPTT